MPKTSGKKLRSGLKITIIVMWTYFIVIMGFIFGGIFSLIGTFAIFSIYGSWMLEIDKTKMNAFLAY